jgi:hypothetical protein
MPKLHIQIDEFMVMNKAQEIWRTDRHVNWSSNPSPFDEPIMRALIKALVTCFNEAVERAIVSYPENNDGLAHFAVFHPADGWVPLCKAGLYVSGTCLECTNKAVPK